MTRTASVQASRFASPQSRGWVHAMAAQDRVLVVLIENGGIDLGVQKLVDAIPGISILSDAQRQELIKAIDGRIRAVTDQLLETAELTINRYSAAKPDLFGDVIVLRDSTASYDDLKRTLLAQSRQGKVIDLIILTHGREEFISVRGGINVQKIKDIRAELGQPLNIRSVYMMNCKASTLNQAWIDAGARVTAGSKQNNYLPEPTTYFFWKNWKEGQSFERAVTGAYISTVNLMNATLRTLVSAIPVVGESLAARIDVSTLDFVRQSEPAIQGQRSLTITSDSLAAALSTANSLVTTVVPAAALQSPAFAAPASLSGTSVMASYRFHSPSALTREPQAYSRAHALPAVLAGLATIDGAALGLAAISVVQAQVSASQGSFALTYDKAQRLLSPDARAKMPGAHVSKTVYRYDLLHLGIGRAFTAEAKIIIEWEGNAYGEVGTPVIRRDLAQSTDWSKSSANVVITKVDRIPVGGTDPRQWPIVYTYEGTFDPLGNGYFEFSGEFEINAFGALKFNRHEVFSRSIADWALAGTPEGKVRKAPDVAGAVIDIPADQIAYLKEHLPA